jgi:hypothetical protein
MPSALSSKLGLKEESRAYLVDVPREVAVELSASGARFSKSLTGSFTFIHAFFVSAVKLDTKFPQLMLHLAKGGALWISWPKAGQLESDLSLRKIIEIGYRHGLVESKTIGVDSTWSAMRFTRPKKGKKYRNSCGKLPSEST